MHFLTVSIIQYVDDAFPGFVLCEFNDAWGKKHRISEKVPVVSAEHIDANTTLPLQGVIAGTKLEEFHSGGIKVVVFDTSIPWSIETIEGFSRFEVLENQVVEMEAESAFRVE